MKTSRTGLAFALAVLAVVLLLPISLFAQSNDGDMRGVVRDVTGASVQVIASRVTEEIIEFEIAQRSFQCPKTRKVEVF